MKWKIGAIMLLLFAGSSCQRSVEEPPGLLTGVHLQATFDIPELADGQAPSHDEMGYLIYLPEGYGQDEDKLWPMIFFLHGAGSGDNNSQFVMSAGLPEVLYSGDQPDPFPFVVVSPQAFPNTAWWVEETILILDSLLDEVIATYLVDPDRVYLTGLSMGGYGTWFLATAFPERFAAAVSVAGSGYRTNYIPDAEYFCQMKDIPLWSIHGALDQISAPEVSKLFTDVLKEECGGEVKWTLYPDVGHMGAYARAYRDPALYEWLLAHQR
jgi:predicted peptidase